MKKHICPNKFYYSYYSVLFCGALFLVPLFGIFSLCFRNMMTFPVFLCGVSALAGLAVLISNQALIWHEKFRPARLMGLVIIVSAGVLGWSISFFEFKPLIYLSYYGDVMFFGFLIMSYLAVKRKPEYDVDYVVILGCSISKDGHLLPLLKARVNRAIHFAWDQEIATGKPVLFVPSGGQGKDEIMSEGSAMEFYLLTHGAEKYEIFPEKNSTNTKENLIFSKEIIDEKLENAKIAFCTTNFHVFRSGILAQKAGLNAQGISSTTKWYFWPNALIREYIGFLSLYPIHHIVLIVCILLAESIEKLLII